MTESVTIEQTVSEAQLDAFEEAMDCLVGRLRTGKTFKELDENGEIHQVFTAACESRGVFADPEQYECLRGAIALGEATRSNPMPFTEDWVAMLALGFVDQRDRNGDPDGAKGSVERAVGVYRKVAGCTGLPQDVKVERRIGDAVYAQRIARRLEVET